MHSSGSWWMEFRLKAYRCVAAGVRCGHMCQCSALIRVRAGSRHLSSSTSLGWCYVHGQPHRLAVGTDPEAKDVSGGTSLGSSGGNGVWWSRSQAPGVCKWKKPVGLSTAKSAGDSQQLCWLLASPVEQVTDNHGHAGLMADIGSYCSSSLFWAVSQLIFYAIEWV